MNEAAVIIAARVGVGLLFSSLIGWLAYRRQSLTFSGVIGAIITGTLIFGLGGIVSGMLLVVFFVTSSALSHYKALRKKSVAAQFDKGSRRDLGQALANGGVASLCAAGSGILWLAGAPAMSQMLCFAALAGALASANADTWATELGVLSKASPRLVTRPSQVVEPGTSGGVTRNGLFAALAGALLIGLANLILMALARAFGAQPWEWQVLYNTPVLANGSVALALVFSSLLGGLVGSLADSILGATVQAIYFSVQRNKATERRVECDGTPNRLLRGWPWLNNDWVNFIASLVGALLAASVSLVASVSLWTYA